MRRAHCVYRNSYQNPSHSTISSSPTYDRAVLAAKPWLSVLVIATALSGCADIVVINDPTDQPYYRAGVENYAARNGAIRVDVGGETFGLAPDVFAARVVNEMRRGYYRHEFFTHESSPATDPHYRIVMMFNPAPSAGGPELCAFDRPLPPLPPTDRTILLAAFCGGSFPISEIKGWVRLSGVEDPKFAALVQSVTNRIFPTRDLSMEPH